MARRKVKAKESPMGDLDELEAELEDMVDGLDDDELEDDLDGEEDEPDLEDMNKRELRKFARENEIKIRGVSKLSEAKLREAIEEALEESEDEDDLDDLDDELDDDLEDELEDDDDLEDEDLEDEEEEVDLDDMNKRELKSFARSQGLKIRNVTKMTEKKLRQTIYDMMQEEEEEDDEVDFGEMGKKELVAYAKENDITIPKNIRRVSALREFLEDYDPDAEEEDEDNFNEMTKAELKDYAEDNDITIPAKVKTVAALRKFLASYDPDAKKKTRSTSRRQRRQTKTPKKAAALMTRGAVNKLLRKVTRVEKLVGEFQDLVEENAAIENKRVLTRAAKKAETLSTVAAEIDDITSEAVESL